MSKQKPYGSWKSSITARLITENEVSLAEPRFSGDSLYWLEGRASDGGRAVIVGRRPDGAIADATPVSLSVRTRVHEYGGAAYAPCGNTLFFSEDSSQRLYRSDGAEDAFPITPMPSTPGSVRYADASISPDGHWLVAVREVHAQDQEAVNDLVVVAADGAVLPRSLISGSDFYSFPRLSPDGRQLLWTSWNHPQMPWDGTELWVADIDEDLCLGMPCHIAGGVEESVFQPSWGADGEIYFISDRTGWWNLYVFRDNRVQALAPMEAEFGQPQWVFGLSRYAFIDGNDGERLVCVYTRNGADYLAIVDTVGNTLDPWPLPYTSISSVTSDGRHSVAIIGSSSAVASELVLLDAAGSSNRKVVRRSLDADFNPEDVSDPEHIEYPSSGGRRAYAFFYPPANQSASGIAGKKPPLIVTSHGGPTSATTSGLKLATQFWTSRGFAVVDVNYGGSTGYGRDYRNSLRGQWGIVDVEDCIEAARHLAERGSVDGERMAIRGKSASGFTTLCCLVFHDLFRAGACYYGVADPEALTRDTHKFEAHYLDGLIGSFPEAKAVYQDRSPLEHAEGLSTPVILFQGLLDPVVPPSQAEALVEVLRKKALPFVYVTFAEERHGFRQAASIRRSLEAELYFYSRVFGFDLADSVDPIRIENFE
jgi:dipeptidyl aminopeptidase/acylaminoacyl peptidase